MDRERGQGDSGAGGDLALHWEHAAVQLLGGAGSLAMQLLPPRSLRCRAYKGRQAACVRGRGAARTKSCAMPGPPAAPACGCATQRHRERGPTVPAHPGDSQQVGDPGWVHVCPSLPAPRPQRCHRDPLVLSAGELCCTVHCCRCWDGAVGLVLSLACMALCPASCWTHSTAGRWPRGW